MHNRTTDIQNLLIITVKGQGMANKIYGVLIQTKFLKGCGHWCFGVNICRETEFKQLYYLCTGYEDMYFRELQQLTL